MQIKHNLNIYTSTGLTAGDLRKVQLTVGVLLDPVAGTCQ